MEAAHLGHQYADVFLDTAKSIEVYEEWKAKTVSARGSGGLRRPLWMNATGPLRVAAGA